MPDSIAVTRRDVHSQHKHFIIFLLACRRQAADSTMSCMQKTLYCNHVNAQQSHLLSSYAFHSCVLHKLHCQQTHMVHTSMELTSLACLSATAPTKCHTTSNLHLSSAAVFPGPVCVLVPQGGHSSPASLVTHPHVLRPSSFHRWPCHHGGMLQ